MGRRAPHRAPDPSPNPRIVGPSPHFPATPMSALAARRLGLSWPALVGLFAMLGVCGSAMSVAVLRDPDTYWHVAAGRWILAHHAIPTADPFSHSMPGAPWTAHEWLSEVILAGSHDAGGWSGLVALTAAALALTLACLTSYFLRHQSSSRALLLVAVSAVLLMPSLLARPHVFTWPLTVVWVVQLLRAGEAQRAPAWGWAVLVALWANLHGSFPLAIGLGMALALDGVSRLPRGERRPVAKRWAAFLGLSVLASLVTPQGVEGWAYFARVLRMDVAMSLINEWQSPDFHAFQPLELVLLQLLGLALLGQARLPLLRVAMVLGLLHLSLTHQRHIALMGLVMPALLAAPLGRLWSASASSEPKAARARPLWIALTLCIVSAGAVGLLRWAAPEPANDGALRSALKTARAAGANGPVLNTYGFGGFLIHHDVPVFIDGRADMYGDAFLAKYRDAMRLKERGDLLELLSKHRIGWTMLAAGTPAIAVLDGLPEWRRVHADGVAVVHVRIAPDVGR